MVRPVTATAPWQQWVRQPRLDCARRWAGGSRGAEGGWQLSRLQCTRHPRRQIHPQAPVRASAGGRASAAGRTAPWRAGLAWRFDSLRPRAGRSSSSQPDSQRRELKLPPPRQTTKAKVVAAFVETAPQVLRLTLSALFYHPLPGERREGRPLEGLKRPVSVNGRS